MSRLIESIRLFNGKFSRLEWHQTRVDNSFRQIFRKNVDWRLESLLSLKPLPSTGLYKCRVIYDDKQANVEFLEYTVNPVKSLKVVLGDHIKYDHKWLDRDQLSNAFAQRGPYDDILIVKNGLITDTYYANIVFRKRDKWFTPQSYLLRGTMRQFLLRTGAIGQRVITEQSFREFEEFKLINAMMGWDSAAIDVSNIG